MEKILITGHKGFIGSHVMELFPEADGFDLVGGQDIRGTLPKKDYTHIIHLAACRSVPWGELNPKKFISTNCWGTCNILKTYPKARILNISSSSAEEHKSVYGTTKAYAEMIGFLHPDCHSVRLYNVFGEGQPLSSGALIPWLIRWKSEGASPIIYGDGNQRRDFTYVKDVALGLKDLLFSNKRGLTHLGYGESITVNDMCKEIFGYMPTPIYFAPRSYDIRYSESPTKCKQVFGRKQGLERTIKWWKEKTT